MTCRKCKKEIPEGSAFCNLCGTKQETPARTPRKRANGQGSIFKRGKGYAACITKYRKGIRETKAKEGFKTRSDAQAWLDEQRISKKKRGGTIRANYTVWKENSMPKLSKSKQTAYGIAWRRIEPLADDDIAEVTIEELQGLIEGLTYYPAKDVKNLLSHIYKRACAQGQAPSNLSVYIELPPLIEVEGESYTREELTAMWDAFGKGVDFVGYMLLMCYSGMMPGELFKCGKEMIRLDSQTIVGSGLKTGERKNKPIVYPKFIVPVIKRLIEISPSDKLMPLWENKFYDTYKEVSEKIGVRVLPPYSCRHTTATALALGDEVNPIVIAKVMRQRKVKTTQRYVHVDEREMINAVETMGENPLSSPPDEQKEAM